MPDIIVREPRTYAIDSPHSFFRDIQRSALGDRESMERLDRHFHEVGAEMRDGTPEGRRAFKEYEQHSRHLRPDASREELHREIRAATSSTIAGFTTPQYIIEEYAVYRSTRRVFADQLRKLPVPSVGLQVNIPSFSAPSSAGILSEGTLITELDPSGTNLVETVQTIVGQVTTSQQLLDRTRSAPNGPSFDIMLYSQIRDDYDAALNTYALGKAINAGQRVAGQATFSLGGVYQDVALAREKLTDTAGTRLQPTHIFTTPDFHSYVTRQLDTQSRPVLTPAFAPGTPVWPEDTNNSAWWSFTGVVLPGTLMWFMDNGIAPVNTNQTQLVVCKPEHIILFEGEPVVRAFPQTLANQLQVVTQLYNYAAVIPRHANATATVSSAAYTTALL